MLTFQLRTSANLRAENREAVFDARALHSCLRVLSILAVVVVLHALAPECRATTMLSNTFDTDAEGSFVQAFNGNTGEILGQFPMAHSAAGGNPGGYIWKADPEPNTWFFSAQAEYLGDISWAYNGYLQFDRIELSPIGDLFSRTVVGLGGAGLIIVRDTAFSGTDWTHHSVRMNETNWVVFPDETPVTPQQYMDVLFNVEAFVIQGDSRFLHDDAAGLDNVMLFIPEPSGFVLAALAGLGLCLFARAASLCSRSRRFRTVTFAE